ncbi:uncharacterized protein LOC133188864 [Saccostrea echinata]|uniref:uncharacterized protein LOC133188864 n=1 Tax=Saccostrea echinata TaxID=191078 RepID=UPI002A817555|nr:uncharacterized protein LOC133188864 [Saccostrea echinata]
MFDVGTCSCSESKVQLGTVSKCPDTLKTKTEAAMRMNCSKIACDTSKTLEYHCVLSPFGDKFMEVCAESVLIIGRYCVEYNPVGKRIQGHYPIQCGLFDNPCPFIYNSTDAYKYSECYRQTENSITPDIDVLLENSTFSTVDNKTTESHEKSGKSGPCETCLFAILPFGVINVCTIGYIVYLRRKYTNYSKAPFLDKDEYSLRK